MVSLEHLESHVLSNVQSDDLLISLHFLKGSSSATFASLVSTVS